MLIEWTTTTVRSTSPIDCSVTDGHIARSRCWSSANSPFSRTERSTGTVALAAPGPEPRPPARHRAAVLLVLGAELAREGRLLVAADECDDGERERRGMRSSTVGRAGAPDRRSSPPLRGTSGSGRGDRGRRRRAAASARPGRASRPLDDEPDEGVHEHDRVATIRARRAPAAAATWLSACQPVSSHGTRPATMPGATTRNSPLPIALRARGSAIDQPQLRACRSRSSARRRGGASGAPPAADPPSEMQPIVGPPVCACRKIPDPFPARPGACCTRPPRGTGRAAAAAASPRCRGERRRRTAGDVLEGVVRRRGRILVHQSPQRSRR